MAHTPAPWEVNREAGPQIREVFAGNTLICDCGLVIEPGTPECEANAHLIAAAPELLDALKALLEWSTSEYQSNPHIEAQARVAIAKAEGK